MLSNSMQKAINEQINKELYSSYLYLSMAAYFENKNLPGFASWMQVESGEEHRTCHEVLQHLLDRGGKVELMPISGLETSWQTNLQVFKQVQEHRGRRDRFHQCPV